MSDPKLRLGFAANARADLRGILAYTKKEWGKEQRDVYRAELDQAFERLRENPELGRTRDEIGPGVRSLVVRRHVILYRVRRETLRILRVVHERMDVAGSV